MTIEEARRLAEQNGHEACFDEDDFVFLDPHFWQCLGKAVGWENDMRVMKMCACSVGSHPRPIGEWEMKWHSFIDTLAEGKSAEDYFATLK
jgi:hypothetical protein